jgi:putative ABC transport system permease protein
MNTARYILRSLWYYRSAHLWVVLGSMMCTAILVGALIVGDSVRYSLQNMVRVRLGDTQFAMSTGDRFFQTDLADTLSDRLGTTAAPILQVKGMAIAEGGKKRVNRISVVGVDGRFGEIGDAQGVYDELSHNEVIVNRSLASQLHLAVGDRLLLRLEALEAMPRDAPLASIEAQTAARSFVIKAIVGSVSFGGFRLQSSQIAPGTAFISLSALAQEMDLGDRANGLLVAERVHTPLLIQEVDAALRESWTLADAGLEWRSVLSGQSDELRSSRIFMDPVVLEAAAQLERRVQPILTYFVNEIRREERYTPYSFVSAPGGPIVPADMQDDEIIINQWLADDIKASVGDRVQLGYFVLERMGRLLEVTSAFRVKAVVPIQGVYADGELLPDFPGLADEAHCRDWEAGVPVDYDRIRPKDEDYWTDFRGTPKAFVTLKAAQQMWDNRFGNLTAIRFEGNQKGKIQQELIGKLNPAQFGLIFRDVKQDGLRASAQSVDFSQLFLGLSFFVILASLLLTGLLFVFHVEKRSRETGLLLALGFSPVAVRRMVLVEGAVLACSGSVLGGVVGIGINQMILQALKTVWSGVVDETILQMHLNPSTILMGVGIGALLAIGVVWLVIRKQTREPITDQQRGTAQIASVPNSVPRISMVVALLCLVAAAALLIYPVEEDRGAMALYFGAGTMVFAGGTALANLLIYFSRRIFRVERLSLFQIGLHSLGRRRLRSLTLVGLLACGLFLVFTVGANRKNATVGADRRESGTGGFALYGESAVPVLHDLNRSEVRKEYGLDLPDQVRFVQFRVKEGDDASCLNLNRVANPQLLGVDPNELAGRKAFAFVQTITEVDQDDPWSILNQTFDGGIIPAVADLTVINWGLGKSVGDTLVYTDERGRAFEVRLVAGLANSVFQGNLIVSEDHLIEKYPSQSDYRLFLVDAPVEALDEISQQISWALQDWGIELIRTSDRLAAFNQVENTYLSIFLILGGFGLILGSVGIGIVVLRSIHERQGEMALLRAVGYSREMLRKMIRCEYLLLLLAGTALGIVSAFVATYPTLTAHGAEIPYSTIISLLILVFVNGSLWIHLATALALRRGLLPALRNE